MLDEAGGSLQEQVTSCTWAVDVGEGADAAAVAAAIEEAPTLVVTRQRKGREVTDDLRAAVVSLGASGRWLRMELATGVRGVRPTELIAAVRPDLEVALVRRTHQWIE
ncbi:MAG: hypothetical protein C4344_04535, partial [Acidimicrobiia bacterium]